MVERRGFSRLLLVAFAAVAAGFVGVAAYSQSRVAQLDLLARSIAGDITPGIERLATARQELRFLERSLYLRVKTPERVTPAEIGQSLARLHEQLADYFALPTVLAERRLSAELRISLQALSQALAGQLARPSPKGLADTLAAIDQADGQIIELLDVNAQAARAAALHIEQSRRRTAELTFTLDMLVLLFTLLAAAALLTYQRIGERLTARRIEELDQFSSRVAHDVLSPLSAVSLALGYGEDHAPDPQMAGMMARGRGGLKRVQRVVDGLLGFARAGAGPEPGARAPIAEVIADVAVGLKPAADEAHVELVTEPGLLAVEPSCAAACSPGVLTSLLQNLVANAIKYMDGAGERRVTVRVVEHRHALRFEVEDSGPGIDPQMVQRIFDPYVRASRGGSGLGLGLATVKRLVVGHGGRLGVEPGRAAQGARGSLFWFELPRA